MKARPFLLGAFLFASLFVAGESVVVLGRVEQAVRTCWSHSRTMSTASSGWLNHLNRAVVAAVKP